MPPLLRGRHAAPRSVMLLVAVFVAACPASRAAGRDAAPQDYGFPAPTPAPALPPEMDVFSPPLLGEASGPAVAAFTRSAGPNEIVVVAGPDFAKTTVFRVHGQTAAGNAVKLERQALVADDVAASVILPDTLPPWSTYLVWPKVAGAYGKPVAVNRTDAWWIGPDRCTAGDTVSVHGRNLSHDNGTATAWLYLQPEAGGVGRWVTPTSVNPYRVGFTAPALAPGGYHVWSHNGHGGAFGWSGPLALTVAERSPFDAHAARTVDVKQHGAAGDGSTDDTAAVRRALAAAGDAAPSTLYFPAGTYVVAGSLEPRSDVTWRGDGRDASAIKVGAGFAASSAAALVFSDSAAVQTVEFKNLAFDGNGNLGKKPLLLFRHHRSVRVTDCRFVWKGTEGGFNIGSNEYLSVRGNEFVGDNIFLGDSRQVSVADNVFRMTDYGHAAVTSWGGSEVSVTGNRARDYDPAASTIGGVGSGRFLETQCHPDANRHFYIADNTTVDMAPPVNIGDANQGEQILFEVGTSTAAASPTAATPTTATFATAPPAHKSQDAVIVRGRGTGQFRRVTAVNGNTITVSPAWSVVPDASSVIGVGPAQTRSVVYRNTFDGKADYRTYATASVAMNMYGNVSDVVFAGNTATDVRAGLVAEFSQVPDPQTPTPSALYFNLVTGNTLRGALYGIGVSTYALTQDAPGTVGHLGNTYRRNRLSDMASHGIHFGSDDRGRAGGDVRQNVFEHNAFANVPTAVRVTLSAPWSKSPVTTQFRDVVLYANQFERGGAGAPGSPAVDVLGTTTTFWAASNTWGGFEKTAADAHTPPPVENVD